jgi:hypothetical protein
MKLGLIFLEYLNSTGDMIGQVRSGQVSYLESRTIYFPTHLPNCYVELSIENRLRGHEYKIKKKPFKTNLKRHYLTNRTFNLWNGLSSDTVSVWTEYTNLKNT